MGQEQIEKSIELQPELKQSNFSNQLIKYAVLLISLAIAFIANYVILRKTESLFSKKDDKKLENIYLNKGNQLFSKTLTIPDTLKKTSIDTIQEDLNNSEMYNPIINNAIKKADAYLNSSSKKLDEKIKIKKELEALYKIPDLSEEQNKKLKIYIEEMNN